MGVVYVVLLEKLAFLEDDLVAIFDSRELAVAFTVRNPGVRGRYVIEERVVNPDFVTSEVGVYLVVLDPKKKELDRVSVIKAFEDERHVYDGPVKKDGGLFVMYLFAADEDDALRKARSKMIAMITDRSWKKLVDEETGSFKGDED